MSNSPNLEAQWSAVCKVMCVHVSECLQRLMDMTTVKIARGRKGKSNKR